MAGVRRRSNLTDMNPPPKPGYSFPIACKLWALGMKARRNWLLRHQHPFNFWIHLLGIPLAFAGLVMLFVAPWEWAAGAIVGGYFLQWVGHRVEGNDVGELIPFKRALGLKAVSIAPQYQQQA